MERISGRKYLCARLLDGSQKITILKKSTTFQSMGRAFIGQVSNRDQCLSSEGLGQVLEVWKQHLGDRPHAEELQDLFAQSHVAHSNLADATRFLVHQLFGRYGLVILDGDNPKLKQEFIPHLQRECEEQLIQKGVK